MPCLWIAIRLKLRGANGSPRTGVDPRRQPRRAAGLLGQHQVAGLAPRRGRRSAARAVPSSRPAAASGRPLLVDDAEHQLAALQQLLHRMGDPAVAALPRCARACGRRRRARRPCPCAPSPCSRGGGPSASQRSGTAQALAAIVDVDDAQHRHLGHPAHLVEGAARAPSRSALRRPCRASSVLSAIFSLPLSPNARAISRLPAGSSRRWMKSRICSRLGRPPLGGSSSPSRPTAAPAAAAACRAGTRRPAPRRRPGSPTRPPPPRRRRTPNRRRGRRADVAEQPGSRRGPADAGAKSPRQSPV